jgi:hypothetical protein
LIYNIYFRDILTIYSLNILIPDTQFFPFWRRSRRAPWLFFNFFCIFRRKQKYAHSRRYIFHYFSFLPNSPYISIHNQKCRLSYDETSQLQKCDTARCIFLIKNYSIFYSNFEIKSMVHICCKFWFIDYCLMSIEQYFSCTHDETKFFKNIVLSLL